MYVRTKAGMIAKIVSKEDVSGSLHREEIVFILDNGNKLALHSKKVLKASHNIIDLIEVGDYVNGYPVIEIPYMEEYKIIYKLYYKNNLLLCTENYEIKSIVTKEQFESIKYSLEG